MSEVVQCPACSRQLRVPEEMLGQRVKCPSCATTFDPVLTVTAIAPPPAPVEVFAEVPAPPPPPPRERPVDVPVSPSQRPGQVQAIALMTLIGGILAVVNAVIFTTASGLFCCLWPGLYYGLVFGIMAIVKGSALLGSNAQLEAAPKSIAIMQIINIINFDVPNCIMGILTLTFLNDPNISKHYKA